MKTAYLSFGSNLGDRLTYLAEAVRRIQSEYTHVVKVSSIYETAPQGRTDQPDFLNLVIRVETELEPHALLSHARSVEQELARVRLERWGPRTVDIDLLLYEGFFCRDTQLQIPHPRMLSRAFVLVPLVEISPFLGPAGGSGLEYRHMLAAVADQEIEATLDPEAFMRLVNRVK